MPLTLTDVVDNLILSTSRHISDSKYYDNVFKNTPFTDRMLKSKAVKDYAGREVLVAHMISKNPEAKSYAPGDTATIGKYNFSDSGKAQWKHIMAPITYLPEEAAQNSGEDQLIPYVKSIIMNSEESFSEAINDQILTGFETAGNGGLDLDPISAAIIRDPTAATLYLGIDPSASATSYHRNQTRNFTGLTTQAAIRNRAFQLVSDCTKGKGGRPTAGFCDFNTSDMLVNIQAAQQRNTNDMGFEEIFVKGIPVYPDESIVSATDGAAIATTNGTIYFVNEKMWSFVFLTSRKREMSEFQRPVNGTQRTALITASATWFVHARRKFGVGFNIDTTVTT